MSKVVVIVSIGTDSVRQVTKALRRYIKSHVISLSTGQSSISSCTLCHNTTQTTLMHTERRTDVCVSTEGASTSSGANSIRKCLAKVLPLLNTSVWKLLSFPSVGFVLIILWFWLLQTLSKAGFKLLIVLIMFKYKCVHFSNVV